MGIKIKLEIAYFMSKLIMDLTIMLHDFNTLSLNFILTELHKFYKHNYEVEKLKETVQTCVNVWNANTNMS